MICVRKILRIFEAQIAQFLTDRDSGVFVRWQPSNIELANPLPTEEDLKAVLLLARAKGDRQSSESLPSIKPMALKAHFAFGPHPAYQIALQILDCWQSARHRSLAGLIMAGRGIEPQRFMWTLEVVSITELFEAFSAVLVIVPDGGLP